MEERIYRDEEVLSVSRSPSPVEHLDHGQILRLTEAFSAWHSTAPSLYIRRVRGRYLLAFLLLRYTGARIGEVLRIDDSSDIDWARSEIHIVTRAAESLREVLRTIPIPLEITGKVIAYLEEFPGMKGKVFALDQGNFRREFYRRAGEASIPRGLSHPHILRHTRAIELLSAGVPLTTVQVILGHSLSGTTAVYLHRSDTATRRILQEKGLL